MDNTFFYIALIALGLIILGMAAAIVATGLLFWETSKWGKAVTDTSINFVIEIRELYKYAGMF